MTTQVETRKRCRLHTSSYPGASTAQIPKQRSQALATKSLHLCFESYDGGSSISYYVVSFTAVSLFGLSGEEGSEGGTSSDQFQGVQFPSSDDGNCLGMCCGTSGSKLYLLGGQNPVNKSSGTDVIPRNSLHDYGSRVFMLDLANSKPPYKASEAPKMLSGMASPLVITVGENLYVLAGKPGKSVYPFEVHDPKKGNWEELPSPPFLTPDSMFFQDPQIRSYVVIDNKIHVSTSSFSFSFDTTTKEWTSCTLFDDPHFKRHRRQWIDTIILYPPNNNDDYGPPFDFNCGAVMYGGDVMICLVSSRGHVVAYELVGGKVKRTQPLKELEIPPDATSAYLADFGDGYLCLSYVFINNGLPKEDWQISITPFQVSKLKSESPQEDQMEKFIESTASRKKLIHPFKVTPPSTEQLPPHEIWSPIGCFVV